MLIQFVSNIHVHTHTHTHIHIVLKIISINKFYIYFVNFLRQKNNFLNIFSTKYSGILYTYTCVKYSLDDQYYWFEGPFDQYLIFHNYW